MAATTGGNIYSANTGTYKRLNNLLGETTQEVTSEMGTTGDITSGELSTQEITTSEITSGSLIATSSFSTASPAVTTGIEDEKSANVKGTVSNCRLLTQ